MATGSDLTGLVRHHGFPLWLVGSTFADAMASMPPAIFDRPPSDLERMRTGALTLFGRPGVARARQLIPMAADWRPDVVVHELFEIAGIEAAAASGALDVVHGFGTQETYLPELASMVCAAAAAELGTPDRTRRLFSSLYLNPYPCGLEPPCRSPFSEVWPIRPEVGTVHPGERLPDRIRDLPYPHTIYLTLGTAFNAPAAWRWLWRRARPAGQRDRDRRARIWTPPSWTATGPRRTGALPTAGAGPAARRRRGQPRRRS